MVWLKNDPRKRNYKLTSVQAKVEIKQLPAIQRISGLRYMGTTSPDTAQQLPSFSAAAWSIRSISAAAPQNPSLSAAAPHESVLLSGGAAESVLLRCHAADSVPPQSCATASLPIPVLAFSTTN
jgi:hypothetical protein